VDVIREIGPSKDFLTHVHTRKHMSAQSQPKLIDRHRMNKWKSMGETDIYQRATEQVHRILETHEPEPLPGDVIENIRSMILETELELGISDK
jgi:trimethylamine--corrinoid protein Co-methyltransferase